MKSQNNGYIFIVILILFPILLFFTKIGYFAFPSNSTFSDLTITHYPNSVYIRDSLSRDHTVPLWSDLIFSGYPFNADPLTGYLYPLNWITYFLPLPFAFNLLIILHAILGSFGLYQFLKCKNLSTLSAIAGGLLFGLMPKLWAHFAAGHISLFSAVCLTPWLLYYVEKSYSSDGAKAGHLIALFFGLIILADIRWAPYALFVWFTYYSYRSLNKKLSYRFSLFFANIVSPLAGALIFSAPLWIPLIQYTQLSTRSSMSLDDSLSFSLPIIKLFGLIFPTIGGNAEWVTYIGVFPFLTFLLAVLFNRKKTIYWISLGIIAIFISISGSIPIISKIWELPGLNLLRVPARAIFLLGLAASVIFAYMIEWLIQRLFTLKNVNFTKFILLIFASIYLVSTFMIYFFSRQLVVQHIFIVLILFVIVIIMFSYFSVSIFSPELCISILLGLTVVDLLLINSAAIRFKSRENVIDGSAGITEFLSSQKDLFRTYSPSYSIPQHIAAINHFSLADGVNPMHLETYSQFMEKATGVKNKGYSVTIPPFYTGNPDFDNRDACPNSMYLGILNVKYIISAYPICSSDLFLVSNIGSSYIYENPKFLPRAWIQNSKAEIGKEILEIPEISMHSNKILLETKGSGLLILSEIYFPGWKVYVDGTRNEMSNLSGIFCGIELPPGPHQVIFQYSPEWFYVGMIISVLFSTFLIIKRFLPSKKERASRD